MRKNIILSVFLASSFLSVNISAQGKTQFRLADSIQIKCGYYFDNNANGFVDSIYVEASTDIVGGLTNGHVQEILDSALTLPAFRDFTINGSGVVSGGFYIDVSEGNTPPTTYVTNDDKITVREDILTMGGWVKDTIVPIYDRVAPIIHWKKGAAFLIDYQLDTISDTLGVLFSEPIENVTHEQPFYFLDVSPNPDTTYTVRLGNVGQPKPDSMVFYVIAHDPTYMEEGDSLWIHETNRVKDILDNNQNNTQNARRKLWVKRILAPYELNPYSTSPIDISNIDSNAYIIPQGYIDILNTQGLLDDLDLSQNSNMDYVGMLIAVIPDDIEFLLPDFTLRGFITIFDAGGNKVTQKNRMGWDDENKSLVWVWNVKSPDGGFISSGTYLCFFEIEEITPSLYPSGGGPKQVMRLVVEVKGSSGSDSCGDCGTSTELAFIPPIGFKIASVIKRRKKWWLHFLKRLKSKITCS